MRWVPLSMMALGCAGELPCDSAPTYPDADGDGYGDRDGATGFACRPQPGFVFDDQDCDDADAEVHPGVAESCDGVDQDCNGLMDDDPQPPLYVDDDNDGYGDPTRPQGCTPFAVADGTDCDDTDPELNPGTTWYEDQDGDGVGGGDSSGIGCIPPAPGHVPRGGDCDDAEPTRYPGAHELCDGLDQDCVDAPEPPDAWAYDGLRVRLPVTVTTPSRATTRPIAFDVDLAAAVVEVGDPQLFAPATLRAALHDCGGSVGSVPLPVQFLDAETGVLAAGGDSDPIGDGIGSVLVLYDLDGDLSTVEELPAGSALELGVYLQGEPPTASWVGSDLEAEDTRLAAGGLEVTFDPAHGGLFSSLTLDGGPSVADMTLASVGNGLRVESSGGVVRGLSAQDVAGDSVVLDASEVTAAVQASGMLEAGSGSFDYRWVWRVFPGRPELWIEPAFHATGAMTASGIDDATEPIRPLQFTFADQVGAVCTTDAALGWADASDGTAGVTWAWAEEPLWVNYLGCTATETWTSANDLVNGEPDPKQPTGLIAAGLDFVDSPVLVLLPHAGDATAVEDQRRAHREGLTVTVGAPQR